VFLANQNSKSKEGQIVAAAFFDKTVGKARETMTATDVYAALNRVVVASSPEMFEAFKEASLTIVFVRNVAPDAGEVHFQIMVRGQSDMDMETLGKKDGRWFIRIKDDPKSTAENFKELFSRSS
jgi:hypothetical protein